ncbi:AAA family ATPase [Streptomyces sp. H27-C3]|uniref:AAA family ATPase n=1 Tax=Streptomyces sp. H27-C3 TaxID=3046305 RepID=UPI0024BACE80|nr:AAA family ATPase [Streptomyces sp. H27-C3]MDJ0463129.1 AAA family ATPase [Streptomyces sp. H27-C3]
MPIRDCAVVAVEGVQAGGKTTLVHALTAHYREQGINVTAMDEPARYSPFLEDIVLHNVGTFDLVAELDAFAQQLSVPMRAARHHSLLIADKTPANVIAYARTVLDLSEPGVGAIIAAMEALCRAWMPLAYDVVIFSRDRFDQKSGGDRFREKVLTLRDEVEAAVFKATVDSGVKVLELPTELSTEGRVEWIAGQLDGLGLAAA